MHFEWIKKKYFQNFQLILTRYYKVKLFEDVGFERKSCKTCRIDSIGHIDENRINCPDHSR